MNKYAEQMRRWSDAKLDKELSFAQYARDNNDTQNLAWLNALYQENGKRAGKAIVQMLKARE